MPSIENVTDELIKGQPAPQEHAIAAEGPSDQSTEDGDRSGPMDREGRAFDPTIHATGKDGSPVLNKDGSIRVKAGRGSPRARSQLNVADEKPNAVNVSTRTGEQIADSIFILGQLIGGEEWAPVKNVEYGIDERATMREAWQKYADEKQWPEPPALLLVIMVSASYAIPRFYQPKTKARLKIAKQWIVNKWRAWRGEPKETAEIKE